MGVFTKRPSKEPRMSPCFAEINWTMSIIATIVASVLLTVVVNLLRKKK
jgi:hypothetical protein